jgi:hypothetical protein
MLAANGGGPAYVPFMLELAAPHHCVDCGRASGHHPRRPEGAAAVAGVGPQVPVGRQGPCGLVAPGDAGTSMLRQLKVWRDGRAVVLDGEKKQWAANFDEFTEILFDGSSFDVGAELYEVTGEGLKRTFQMRAELTDADRTARALRLRRLIDAARAVLRILKMEARALFFLKGEETKVVKLSFEQPVAVHVADLVLREAEAKQLGVIFPWTEEEARSPEYPLWWALYIASLQFDGFHTVLERTFKTRVREWAAANKEQVADHAIWLMQLRKLAPNAASGGKRQREEVQQPAQGAGQKSRRLSKAARRKHAAEKAAADGGGSDGVGSGSPDGGAARTTTALLDGGGRGYTFRGGRGGGRGDGRGRGRGGGRGRRG